MQDTSYQTQKYMIYSKQPDINKFTAFLVMRAIFEKMCIQGQGQGKKVIVAIFKTVFKFETIPCNVQHVRKNILFEFCRYLHSYLIYKEKRARKQSVAKIRERAKTTIFIHFLPVNVHYVTTKLLCELRYIQSVKLDSGPKLSAEEDYVG